MADYNELKFWNLAESEVAKMIQFPASITSVSITKQANFVSVLCRDSNVVRVLVSEFRRKTLKVSWA